VVVKEKDKFRITQSLKTALKEGSGIMMVQLPDTNETRHFSQFLMCPTSGISYDEPAPNLFSFNSAYGACPTCQGFGKVDEMTEEGLIPNRKLNVKKGGIAPLGVYKDSWIFHKIEAILKNHRYTLSTPFEKMTEEAIKEILHGAKGKIKVQSVKYPGTNWNTTFEGVIHYVTNQRDNGTEKMQEWAEDFISTKTCPDCQGERLRIEARHFKIADHNIAQLAQMNIEKLGAWFVGVEDKLSERQNVIATEILKEIRKRLGFLIDVGLTYLDLNRPLKTLSGGEAQRIRLATQIGTQLVGVLYILDEPSIGLHQRDNVKLIKALQDLRDLGNSVVVVEHDRDMMLASDYVIDIGPGAGVHGGRVVAQGIPSEIQKQESTTANFLNGKLQIETPTKRRQGLKEGRKALKIALKGASGNNLKNLNVDFPLGKMICVTGVSGSGKSTLIHDTLFPILRQYFYKSKQEPLAYKSLDGIDLVDKVIEIDQKPIGRTPRSNPATYTGMFTDIRTLFTMLPEAKIRGYKAGRFSFNVKGGRCEECRGGGMRVVEMDFLPDVYVDCESCRGKRYNRETLEIRFKGKSISDVLDMTVEQASTFFEKLPKIYRKVKALADVGLGYITLGQHATTISGGEAQRVKLATELSKRDTGKTFYILDEPTTGLHFQDIKLLLGVLNALVDKGNTVLIIEHNLDVIKVADHIIDIGPEGGEGGGEVVAKGTPEQVAKVKESYTGSFLKDEL
jgi:excinuclease ABC subunit A